MRRLWIICDEFFPDDTSTAFVLTKIAAELAAENDVHVLTVRRAGQSAREEHAGVRIHRVRTGRLAGNRLFARVLNGVTTAVATFVQMLVRLRRGDVMISTSNPPTLSLPMLLAAKLRRATFVLLFHDVYPHALAAAGMIRPGSILYRVGCAVTSRAVRSAAATIAIGRDMARLLCELGGEKARVVVIPNWADVDEIHPLPRDTNRILREHDLLGAFVVQYAGNLGRTHDVETLLEAARLLQVRRDIRFLIAGDGAKRPLVERAALPNVTFVGRQSRAHLAELLAACDLSVIALNKGMRGVSVPSRMYNVLASGRPILGICAADSELALMLEEQGAGWRADNDPQQVASLIAWAADHRDEARAAGQRGARAARRFPLRVAGERYRDLLSVLRRQDGDAAARAADGRDERGDGVIGADDAQHGLDAEADPQLAQRDQRVAQERPVVHAGGRWEDSGE